MSIKPHSLAQLLEVENDPELINFRCPRTGIPIWVSIRQPVLRMFGAGTFYATNFIADDYRLLDGLSAKASALLRSEAHNIVAVSRLRRQGEITLSASGAGLVDRSGELFNRLSDYFILAEPARSVSIEDLFAWRWPFPRANNRVIFRAPVQARVAFRGRLLERGQKAEAERFVNHLSNRLVSVLGVTLGPGRSEWLSSLVARWLVTAPYEVGAYKQLFGRLGTRVLMKEEGCYGHAATMIVAARELGVVTAEYQHGLINKNHDAYNFAEAVQRSAAHRRTLPDYLLTYGEWWQSQINVPIVKLAIGNPHRDGVLANWRAAPRSDVLVLGEGVDRDYYLDVCRRLASLVPARFRVVFRPHPLERHHFADALSRSKWSGISIDANDDIYASFRTAAAVIGESSTALFEAAGLVDRIFVLDSDKSRFSLPDHPFARFTDLGEIEHLLRREQAVGSQINGDALWAPGWRARYSNFLQSVGI